MTETHHCPTCREPLDVPASMLGQPVRCGNCSTVFTPREPELAAEFDAPTVTRRRHRRTPESGGGTPWKGLLIAFGIVGVLGLFCCGGMCVFFYKMMNPQWERYSSASGDYTAIFPGTVTGSSTRSTGRGAELAPTISVNRFMGQEEFFIMTVPLSDTDRKKRDERLLNELADGFTQAVKNSKEYRPRITRTHLGFEALEVALECDNDQFLQARIIRTPKNAYIVGYKGPHEPDAAVPYIEEFFDGFQPTAQANDLRNPFRK